VPDVRQCQKNEVCCYRRKEDRDLEPAGDDSAGNNENSGEETSAVSGQVADEHTEREPIEETSNYGHDDDGYEEIAEGSTPPILQENGPKIQFDCGKREPVFTDRIYGDMEGT